MKSKSNEDLGEPIRYDPDFNGPLKKRSCTDVTCLLLILVCAACWIGVGLYVFTKGDPSMLLVPKDSAGSRCGVDSHVRDRKYLFFFDLTRCLEATVPFTGCKTTQVCVRECPSENYISDGTAYKGDPQYCNTYDNAPTTDCPSWYLKSTVFQKRCIPNVKDINETVIQLINEHTYIHTTLEMIKTSISNIKLFAQAEEIGQNVVEDIMNSWLHILIGVALSLVACIIFILLLRWTATPVIWLSIGGVVGALGFGVFFTAKKYIEYNDAYHAAVYEEVMSQLKTKRDLWLTGLIILCVVLVIILLMLIFLRKRIVLAIALIREGSKAVSSVTASLFFPIIPWLLQLGIIAYTISYALFLSSTGEPVYKTRYVNADCPIFKDDAVCDPETFIRNLSSLPEALRPACANATCKFIKMQYDAFYPYLQAFNVFQFFWLIFFVVAFEQMVLASVFAQWYWTFHKRTLPFFAVTEAVGRTARYHLGTLAFGSLIIAICRIIRVVLEYIDHKLKNHENELTKAILCCCKCFFWCLENFLKFINKNAYIMCAIHGKNFCASAKDAFKLLMRNIIRVFVLDKVTDFLFFLSKLLITFGVGAVSYVIFATDLTSFDNSGLNYGVVPVVIIMICSFLISSVFFNVYSMAVDTLFLCFLEDCERNDGSAEKPYYMSKNLMKIFGKKNKLE